jgi:membrane protease YdiL (CAAX protease family)
MNNEAQTIVLSKVWRLLIFFFNLLILFFFFLKPLIGPLISFLLSLPISVILSFGIDALSHKYNAFFNSNHQLRAGWRIELYIVSLIFLMIPFGMTFPLINAVFGGKTFMSEAMVKLLLTIASVIASYLLLHFLDKRKFSSMGLNFRKNWRRELWWGVAIGFLILTLAVGAMQLVGYEDIHLADETADYFTVGLALNIFLYIIVGFNEEILFRGYIFQSLIEGTNKVFAVAFFSLLFGAAHLGNPNVSVFGIANIVLAGVLLSLAYIQTKSLWLPIGIHIGWNFTQGYIWGLPVSGTAVFKPLMISQETGPDMITGGAFGPEGGAACTVVCILACLFVWKYFRPTEEMESLVTEAVGVETFKPAETALLENTNGTH